MSIQRARREEIVGFVGPARAVDGPETSANRTMKSAKQIIFRYNDDPATEEVDLDMDGDKSIPEQGVFIERKGQR